MKEASEISLTEHQRYWLNHVRACEASGKRIAEYAAEHGLGIRAMYEASGCRSRKACYPARVQPGFSGLRWLVR